MASHPTDVSAAKGGQVITKSDSTTYPPTRGILVGTAGNLAVVMADMNSAITIPNLVAGIIHPISATKIMSTNTAMSDIVAFW